LSAVLSACNRSTDHARTTAFAVALPHDDLHGRVELAKALERDVEAGDHAVGVGDERAAGPDDRRNGGLRRHVMRPAQDISKIFL
jgi:hypothetical protein